MPESRPRTLGNFGICFIFIIFILSAVPRLQAEETWADMPWHLVNIRWDFDRSTPFESLSVDVTIQGTVAPDADLYIAPIGGARIGGAAFYGGLQTDMHTRLKEDPLRVRQVGRGVIFSRWGERSYDAIRPAPPGYCDSSGHEGDFIGVRRNYPWAQGTYTYRLIAMDLQITRTGTSVWVGCFVRDANKGDEEFIGALLFPTARPDLSPVISSFVEIYGQRKPLEKIPKLTISIDNWTINGLPAVPKSVRAHYKDGIPPFALASKGENADVVIEVGKTRGPGGCAAYSEMRVMGETVSRRLTLPSRLP